MKHFIIALTVATMSIGTATTAHAFMQKLVPQSADAPPPAEVSAKNCTEWYKGNHSRVYTCDDGTFGWDMPTGWYRIDKPFQPGPNSIVRAPERMIRGNLKGIENAARKLFGG
jgi:hypothetical protein